MRVESPKDLVKAYATQVAWLNSRLDQLKLADGTEVDDPYKKVQEELDWAKTALDRIRGIVTAPNGRLVEVLKSKVVNIRNKVGRVTYVNTDRNYATVSFDGGVHSHSLSLNNLVVVDIPVPSFRIPAAGMVVKFKDNPEEYVSMAWSEDKVYVETVASVTSGDSDWTRECRQKWVDREKIETVNGTAPV